MKLLEKSQINNIKNIERKSEIDSGVTLARKIDVLRVDVASLEKQKSDFIEKTRAEISELHRKKEEKLGELDSEILAAEKKLKELREPLDAEWTKVRGIELQLNTEKEETQTFFKGLIEQRSELDKKNDTVTLLLQELEDSKNSQLKNEKVSKQKLRDSEILFKEAQTLKETFEGRIYEKETDLVRREKMLEVKKGEYEKNLEKFNQEKQLLEIKKKRWKI